MKKYINKLWELIKKSNKILLINHVRMDPDAFGSLSAMYFILKKQNKTIEAINDENMPESFSFMNNFNIFNPNLDLKSFNPDLIISFDAASTSQLWNTYIKNENIFKNTTFVVIDHHITNPWFWDLNIINIKSSSTCELIYDISIQLNFEKYIDKGIATFLTAWMLTDTNMYYNVNTTPHTLYVASQLLKHWADFRSPIFEFFKKKTFNKTLLWWEALKIINKSKNWKIVWTIINKDMLKKTDTTDRDINWIIDTLINIDISEIAFIIYPLPDWLNKVSFRSNSFNVSDICESFWWWWHKQAAGFSSDKNPNKLTELILERIKEL